MHTRPVSVLIVENNPRELRLLQEMLAESGFSERLSTAAVRLDEALRCLGERRFDIILLNLDLPDGKGFHTFARVQEQVPHVPIIILTDIKGESLALRALRQGAQDYLVKGEFDGNLLVRAMRHAIERQKVQEKLRRNEERWRAYIEQANDLIFTLDTGGRITSANRALCTAAGYTEEELLGKHVLELVSPESSDAAAEALARILKEQDVDQIELEALTKDSRRLPIEVRGRILYQVGKFSGTFHIARDITERIKSEQALRRRAEELDALQATVLEITAPHDLPALLEAIVERATRLLDTPMGGLYLCDADRQEVRCVVSHNTPRDYRGTVLSYGEGAAGTAARTARPVVVDDYRAWDGRAPVYEEERAFRAVLAVPMLWRRRPIGVIDVMESAEGRAFSQADLRLLTLFANHAAIAVENTRLYEQAQQEIAERRQTEQQLEASLLEKEVLLKEIHHRVKNNLQVISSLLSLQADSIGDPEMCEMFLDSRSRIEAMALIHDRLYRSPDLTSINAGQFVRDLVTHLFEIYANPMRDVREVVDVSDVTLGIDCAISCGLILTELVSNALKHAFPPDRYGEGGIRVEMRDTGEGHLVLVVADDGVGLSPELDWRNTQSLGMQLVNLLVEQLEGTVELDRSTGTTFRITFPA